MHNTIIMISRLLLPFLFAIAFNYLSYGQVSFNSSFERYERTHFRPALWMAEGDSDIRVDTVVSHSGRASLKISSTRSGRDSVKGYPGGLVSANDIPLTLIKNKHCRISGFVKVEDVLKEGTYRVGFFVKMIDHKGKNFLYQLTDSSIFRGTQDWTFHTKEFFVPDSTATVTWGASFIGSGTVWYDDIRIEIDGKELTDTELEAPTKTQITWLQKNMVALDDGNAANRNTNLAAFKKEIGTAKIIALGEATHGTSEIFTMKHRLLEYLANETNVGVFAMEAYMPEAYKVNDYVLHGKGTPEDCVYGMKFWTWRNEEVVNLIKWMKAYNETHTKKIRFEGFDMQSSKQALENIRAFVLQQSDSTLKSECDTLSKSIEIVETATRQGTITAPLVSVAIQNAQTFYTRLYSSISATKPSPEKERILQDCRIVLQAMTIISLDVTQQAFASGTYRDSCMAENIRWIASQTKPDERIVLWAHNEHIMKSRQAKGTTRMGVFLDDMFRKNYYALGFSCGNGSYTAYNFDSNKVVRNNTLIEPYTGTIEEYFRAARISSGILFTKYITRQSPLAQWLTTPFELRSIGSVAEKQQYHSCIIPESYDALLYIDSTTSSKLLPPKPKK
jgi:erythromycin esterase